MTTSAVPPSEPRTKRGPKPMLSQAAVLEAALELVDADGLGSLNLRKLATRLGVSAMTPYSYFANKAQLLAAMVGHVLEPLGRDLDTEGPWDRQVETAIRDLHRALELHPGVVELIITESDAARLDEFRQRLITILERAGLTRSASADALRTLTSYILGYTLLNRLRPASSSRGRMPDPFESGLQMIMNSLRRTAADPP